MLTHSVAAQGTGGLATVDSDGNVLRRPHTGFADDDFFSLAAEDEDGETGTVRHMITVAAADPSNQPTDGSAGDEPDQAGGEVLGSQLLPPLPAGAPAPH